MKDSILCCAFCLGLGMVVGGVIVSNNSKLRSVISKTQDKAMDMFESVKNEIEEQKVQNTAKMQKKDF